MTQEEVKKDVVQHHQDSPYYWECNGISDEIEEPDEEGVPAKDFRLKEAAKIEEKKLVMLKY